MKCGWSLPRKVRNMWPALSKDPKDLVVRMRVPPASLSQSQGWSPLPSLWQLGRPFLNHRKTPWQSRLQATSPHCCLIKVLLLKMSSFCGITIFFLSTNTYSVRLESTIFASDGNQRAERWAEDLGLPGSPRVFSIWGQQGPLVFTDGWPTNVMSQHGDSGVCPPDKWPLEILLKGIYYRSSIFAFLSEKKKKKEKKLDNFNFPPQITKAIQVHVIASKKPGH